MSLAEALKPETLKLGWQYRVIVFLLWLLRLDSISEAQGQPLFDGESEPGKPLRRDLTGDRQESTGHLFNMPNVGT